MRVCFDARYLGGSASGIGTYCSNLLREALALDPDLSFLLVTRHPGVAASLDPARCQEVMFPHEPRSLRTLHLLPVALRGRRFDVFHGPFNILPSHLQVPSVVTVHDVMQLQNPANIATSWFVQNTAGRFWRVRIAHAVRAASQVLAVSHATRDAILERFPDVDETRVSVSPNGTDPYFGEPADADALAKVPGIVGGAGGSADAPFVLMVGNESPHKNHHRGVRAFIEADLGDTKLVLVRRSVRHDPRMDALLKRPEVQRKVVVVGHVDRPVLRALYRQARVFLFPSWVEGFGLPILEAMAAECPVLTADRSAPAEVAGDAALKASPFEVAEMAAALRRLVNDDALRAELVPKGLARVADFSWKRTAEVTLQSYRAAGGVA